MRQIVRTDDEIDDVLNRAAEVHESQTRWPGKTYEEGVEQAILWLLGDSDDNPMDD